MKLAQKPNSQRLSRIVGNILRDLYGIRPPSSETLHKLASKYASQLESWRTSLGYLVDTDGVDPSMFQPIFLRQRNVLNLAFWHAQILIHRPFLLNNFANLANLGSTRQRQAGPNAEASATHVKKCLDAAMSIVSKVDELHSTGQLYGTFWVSPHPLLRDLSC